MFSWNWKKEILTVPNLLSLFRLALIPVYISAYLRAQTGRDHALAAGILAVSCLTDLLDGIIARRFHMISHVGKVLDPLADKLTQLALMLSLSKAYRILYPILILFLVKELFQFITLLIFARKGRFLPGALLSGKICTAVLFISLLLLVLFPGIPYDTVRILMAADAVLLLYAFWGYANAYFGKSVKLTDLQNE